MSDTGHHELQELLGAYALDAVDRAEAEAVARHLETCPRCRDEVRQHREVAGLLGSSGGPAPDGVWERIAAAMEAPPAVPPAMTALPDLTGRRSAGRRQSRARSVAALAMVAAAAVAAILGVQVVRLDHRTTALSQALGASAPTMKAVQSALRVPGARRATLRSLGGATIGDVVVLPGGQGYVYATSLQPLPSSRTYQLWGIGGAGGAAISYGLLGTTPAAVAPFQADNGVSELAITAEVRGGVEHSSQQPVAIGALVPV